MRIRSIVFFRPTNIDRTREMAETMIERGDKNATKSTSNSEIDRKVNSSGLWYGLSI